MADDEGPAFLDQPGRFDAGALAAAADSARRAADLTLHDEAAVRQLVSLLARIGDSTAIIAALEDFRPDPPLYPADPADRARALESGFDHYIVKPLRIDDLERVLALRPDVVLAWPTGTPATTIAAILASLSSGALCTDWGAAAMLSLFSSEPEAQATPAMTSWR